MFPKLIIDGFHVVRGALSSSEISYYRAALDELFSTEHRLGDSANVRYNLLRYYPFRPLLYNGLLNNALRKCLASPLIVCRSMSALCNWWAPWHRDVTSQIEKGFTFHNDPECLQIQTGFYLQDGSLDIWPKSHLLPDLTAENVQISQGITLDTKAGDCILWDSRIWHRATPRAGETTKYAIYNLYSCCRAHAEKYHEYIYAVAEEKYPYLLEDNPIYDEPFVREAEGKNVILL